MGAVKDLIEDWIAMRATLVRQLERLKSGQTQADIAESGVSMEVTIVHVEACIRELNTLLKEFARLHDR